ncbi:unnamed protein product [Ophioblennius macclurei]
MGRQCHLCHHTCRECTDEGPDRCTSCDRDRFGMSRYLFGGQCREVCPGGFFPSEWKKCESCPEACIICTAADRCLLCSVGYKLRYGRCVPLECRPGEVSNADSGCVPCDEGCETCERDDTGDEQHETICLKCEPGFYLLDSDCHLSCPDGTYSVKDTMQCSPCEDTHCEVCDHSQCYFCEDGFYVSAGECVDHCEEGFFVDKKSQECEPCHRDCRSCGGPASDDCHSCEDGFVLENRKCLEGRELALHSENHFRRSQKKRDVCHPNCKTCHGPGKDDCSSCHPDRFLTAEQNCVVRCPTGTFGNEASGKCEDCVAGCSTCQDAKKCQWCRDKLYLHDGACVEECPRGFPKDDVCQPCAPECASCEGSPTNCLSCEMQYLLLDHSCKDHCPQGYYADDKECHRCSVHCIDCNRDGFCKKCREYYFLFEDRCVDNCPKGYFINVKEQACMVCHADCASCDGPDKDDCDICRNPKAVRHNGECLSQCPDNTYHDGVTSECRDCDKSCLTCSGYEPSSCLSCDAGKHKDATGHCVWDNQCSLTSYTDEKGKCQPCHSSCHQCSGPGKDHCLNCNEPRFLLNNTCVKKCPVGYYAEEKGERSCERCHFSCQSCVGRHSVQCSTCKPGFLKQGSLCVETCSENHFVNKSSQICERCDPSCNKCWGPGNTNCLTCRVGYIYMKHWNQCLKSCPSGYYPDKSDAACHQCHPTCKTCSDKTAIGCQSCYHGFTFMRGICASQCLTGFYSAAQESETKDSWNNEHNCKPCDQSCFKCRGPGMRNCTLCHPSQILSEDDRCLTCCGKETNGPDDPMPRECCNCTISEAECIMSVNFKITAAGQSSSARVFVTLCVLFILFVGGGVFAFLNARSKNTAFSAQTNAQGYRKLKTNGSTVSEPSTSPYGEYMDRIVDSEDEYEEDDEDEDIVYMGQDGTVYRKFKYGDLEEEEIDLEYDDESFSWR